MLLEGIFLPLTTPFHPDGRIFLRKMETNVERYSRTPASGMLVLGREGEGDALTDAETREALATALGAAADEKVMIANVGRESVAATLELAETAAAAGYDAIAVRPPGFAADAAMRLETTTYFLAIADRSALPVVLLGERTPGVDVVAELAGHPRIIASVEEDASPQRLAQLVAATAGVSREVIVTTTFAAATGRMLRNAEPAANFVPSASLGGGAAVLTAATPKLRTRVKRVGFQLLAGRTGVMLDAWNSGCAGAVPRLAACAPQACCEVWQAFRDGDPALAAEKQERVRGVGALVEGWRGIAALKYGCDLNAYFGGRPRLPLLPLTAAERHTMEAALAGIKN